MTVAYRIVGRRLAKVDAREKVTGEARYAGDIHLPGTVHGMILTSPVPHARLLGVDTSEAESLPGVLAVVRARDAMPGCIGLFIRDRTPLASGKVRYIGEPVAAVAAVDEATAREALSRIRVTYEELPAVFDPVEALQPEPPSYMKSYPAILIPFLPNDMATSVTRYVTVGATSTAPWLKPTWYIRKHTRPSQCTPVISSLGPPWRWRILPVLSLSGAAAKGHLFSGVKSRRCLASPLARCGLLPLLLGGITEARVLA